MKRPSALLPLLLAPLVLTAGCSLVSPEAKVRDRLVQAGLDPTTAQCMARKLVKHLDSNQLSELGRAMKMPKDHPGKLRLDEIGRRLETVQDPKIIAVTTRAGLSCAIMG
jgi:hypothetical protein